jgi:hypothetical protein
MAAMMSEGGNTMNPRWEIATVLCLTGILSVGCACGVRKPENVAPRNFAASAGAGPVVAEASGRTAENSVPQRERGERLKKAAAFHDHGRYYK